MPKSTRLPIQLIDITREYFSSHELGLMPREIRWGDQLFIIENVPMGVCSQCGEKVIKPKVAEVIDQIIEEEREPTKTIQVPVYQYELNLAEQSAPRIKDPLAGLRSAPANKRIERMSTGSKQACSPRPPLIRGALG